MTTRVRTLTSLRQKRVKILEKHNLPVILALTYPTATKYYQMPGCSYTVRPYLHGKYHNIQRACRHKALYSLNGSLLCELHAGLIAARALADFVALTETANAQETSNASVPVGSVTGAGSPPLPRSRRKDGKAP